MRESQRAPVRAEVKQRRDSRSAAATKADMGAEAAITGGRGKATAAAEHRRGRGQPLGGFPEQAQRLAEWSG